MTTYKIDKTGGLTDLGKGGNGPDPAPPFGSAELNFCLQTRQEYVFNTPGTSDEIVDWVRLVKL